MDNNEPELKIKRRHLPHWTLEDSTYFVTFRLNNGVLSSKEIVLVLEHIVSGDSKFYDLFSVVVMPDHIHLIIKPNASIELPRVMKGIKGATAKKINNLRGSSGTIWRNEYFDRIIRDQKELEEKLMYMWGNPVKAELTANGFDYEGSYFKGCVSSDDFIYRKGY